jgi:2-keto-4-pentenoate hydratase/2-oxohepta-3-ene-1,7-dioic acid hydratase in catechol pathway
VRIARFRYDGTTAIGRVEGDRIVELPAIGSLHDLLARPATAADDGAVLRLDAVDLEAPVAPLRRNLFCVGWNYAEHFDEGKAHRLNQATELPDRPTFFTKATGTLIGPRDPIDGHPSVTQTMDWEVELAVVIGQDGVDIPVERALDHVFGFAVANDASARNVQAGHGGQWFRGKSLDRTCPVGPWIVTRDELDDLSGLTITCRVNGETVQQAHLGDMYFDIPHIIAELSAGLTLEAGDVILTGTPPGVGFARTPPRYLSIGDVVESEIERIGLLRNEVTG